MKKTKKILKITGIVFGVFVAIVLIAAILIPYFFKDDIKAQIDKAIAEYVEAEVKFEADDFSLSLLSNFPNITIAQKNLAVVGKGAFKGDTLLDVERFSVTIDLWSVLFSSEPSIRGIYVDSPKVLVKVLKNGKANYDIVKASDKEEVEKETDFKLNIKKWQIENAYIVYDDKSLKTFTKIENLNHTGRGKLNQDVFDLFLDLRIEKLTVSYEGVTYIEDELLDTDLRLLVDNKNYKYTFKENKIQLNDFKFGLEGFVQMVGEDIKMNIDFKAKENKFKNILSLVPGMFTEDFEDIKTSGNLAFKGFVKGVYNEKSMPGFKVSLKVKDGKFRYPKLPTEVSNIQLDLLMDNESGVLNDILIHLKKFHIDLGKNPVNGYLKFEKLTNSQVDADITAKISLSDLTKIFPMEGITVSGSYVLNLKAKGNLSQSQTPQIQADMSLTNGYLKTKQYPDALEKLGFQSSVTNSSGRYENTKIRVQDFDMVLDGEPFTMTALVENLDDIRYDIKVKGGINLEKLMHLYPVEGTTLTGNIRADLSTKGQVSAITNGQYNKLPTSGSLNIKKFLYREKDYLPQGFKITEAYTTLSPQKIDLEKFEGFLGKSDVSLKGSLSNYLGYFFVPESKIIGNMTFRSKQFDANEWLSSEKSTASSVEKTSLKTSKSESEESLVVQIPENIDFTLNSTINKVLYGKMTIRNLKGLITIKEGILTMKDVNFSTLGGSFIANGSYDPRDIKHPKYSFDFGIKTLPISTVYKNLMPIGPKSLSPNNIKGKLSSLFKIKGELGQDLFPKFNKTMQGFFSLDIDNASVKNAPIFDRLNSFMQLSDLKNINLKDIMVKAKIKNGRVQYKPFDLRFNDYKMYVEGNNGVDGSLDFKLKIDIPKAKIGGLASTALATLTGKNISEQDNIMLDFLIGGTYLKPKVTPVSSSGKPLKTRVEEKIKEELKVEEKKEEIRKNVKEEAEKIMTEARKQADKVKASARETADKIRQEADEKAEQFVEEAMKNYTLPIGKDKARQTAEATAKETIKDPAYKQAQKLENEAKTQAQKILNSAQKRVDKL